MTKLLLATRNAHKVGEIRAILGDRFQYLTLTDFPNAPEVVEDADTFAGNAIKKGTELARWVSLASPAIRHPSPDFILADDSGLEVDALGGRPGVHSARFAALDTGVAGNSPDTANTAKLLRLLQDVPAEKRTARFRCVLALTTFIGDTVENASPVCYARGFERETTLFEGDCEGRIDFVTHGANGFGYDPLFIPIGYNQSFAELGDVLKNQLSHRAQALNQLRAALGV